MMEGSPRQYVTDASVDEPTCWRRFFKSRVAMLFYGLVALSPLVDVSSDLLTAVNFVYYGHCWWAAMTLAVFYMSGRLVVVFMALCPTPNARNLICLYLPGFWKMVHVEKRPHELEGLVAKTHSTQRYGDQQQLQVPPTSQKASQLWILRGAELTRPGCVGRLFWEVVTDKRRMIFV